MGLGVAGFRLETDPSIPVLTIELAGVASVGTFFKAYVSGDRFLTSAVFSDFCSVVLWFDLFDFYTRRLTALHGQIVGGCCELAVCEDTFVDISFDMSCR